MILRTLEKSKFTVAAVAEAHNGQTICPVLDFLQKRPPNQVKAAAGFKALFEIYAKNGRSGLTYDMFHRANKKDEIWEFVKGDLRIFCFIDDNGLVILSNGGVKHSQKVDKKDLADAVRVRDEYLEDKRFGRLIFIK